MNEAVRRRARRPFLAGFEQRLFLTAVGVTALHVLEDSFLQPQPGTSAGDHLVSGVVPLAVLALAALAYPRLRGGARAAVSLVVGFFGIAFGIEGAYYTAQVGPSGDDFTGLLSMLAGIALLGLGLVTLCRTGRRHGGLLRRSLRRAAIGAAGLVVALYGGELQAGPRPDGGYEVSARLPLGERDP